MDVAILTVGDEVLAGDTENTNATWLARRLTDAGVTVTRILTVPDDRDVIRETVDEWRSTFDAVVVTGGLGGTHDDVTVDAIADAFDRDLVVDPTVREDVVETVAAYRDRNPDLVEAHDLDLDVDAWAALPAGSRPLVNPEGLCPGCVVENVYVFPGVPAEMQALFDLVAGEFGGDAVSTTLYTPQPEGSMVEDIAGLRERFDVTVGSYPSTETRNRIKLTGTDAAEVARAADWLRERIDIVDDP
ncbi:competence/damage-inducible protein A [Haloplanus aerogenes]|uniref:Competence/damage-inducible protein A n=1 Tax=Haloplanus aerogenes TaxID=660522 RepID=A0A3M0EC51_9EURY|nr:molybdopterin-binding protein [Haloplanus aerogenes]AZH25707.1 competence/damage-inducible protein A [Haloplanus aerogenes]RMB25440.1 molybdenum cofactor synthesis domain-containing protein [Haloplanus aerogenes]